MRNILFSSAALMLIATTSFAQTTAPADPAPTPPPAATPMTPEAPAAPVDCTADFTRLDANSDGVLTEAEASAAYARARLDGVTIAPEGLTAENYAAICGADHWQNHTPEEGAPLEGANSFTEEQARDRALSWNFTDVSALTKDDQGIWRGTAKQGDAAVNIAVDYKGNVVATPGS